jgi:hypothetical protein
MSSGSSLPYRLRQNKAVDRELFLALLGRLAATLKIESYQYVGLGGPFLEDFRLIHGRIGISEMVCIDSEEAVHHRQIFNRPVECIKCIHDTLENYLDSTEFEKPLIIWFDYTDPKKLTDQIERFARSISEVPIGSILRITLNANPSSLGTPKDSELAVEIGDMTSRLGTKKTVREWRLDRFHERLGNFTPDNLQPDDMAFNNYGRSILNALYIAVEKELLSHPDRKIVWSLATHYADGQPMATATIIICCPEDEVVPKIVNEWTYFSTPAAPLILDMPSLSTRERLTMESFDDPESLMGFELPISDMGENPFESFKKFYRVFPHFSRVEL